MTPTRTSTELRDRVKVALHRSASPPGVRRLGAEADAVLAALGLADFDAAVKRMADWEGDWYDRADVEENCRVALRVALGLSAGA